MKKTRQTPLSERAYKAELYTQEKEERLKQSTFLTGLFTSKYNDQFMLHYYCPLCGDQIVVQRHLAPNTSIDFESDVAGDMVNQMRQELSKHYAKECGSDRDRRERTAAVLLDKYQDRVYR